MVQTGHVEFSASSRFGPHLKGKITLSFKGWRERLGQEASEPKSVHMTYLDTCAVQKVISGNLPSFFGRPITLGRSVKGWV